MECRVRRLRRNTFISYAVTGSVPINRGLIQAILTSLPPQPIGEATKASNLQRIPPRVQGRSHFTYFLLWFRWIFLDYRVTLGFGSTGGLDLACPIIRLSSQYGIQRVLGRISNSLPGVGTNRSMHLLLNILKKHRNLSEGVNNLHRHSKPKIGYDVEFEINANFMRELRCKLFTGTDDEDTYEHVHMVLEIVDLFHFPGVTHDAIMLRVFPITLKGRALRWKFRLPAGSITTWDLEKAYQLTHKVLTNTGEKVKAITTMSKGNMKESVPRDLPPTPFLRHLKEQMGSSYKTRETVRMNENPKEIHNARAQDNEGDMDVGWDITSKDVERLRQSLTPTTHTLPNLESIGKPYIPLGLVHDREKIIREEEQDYDISLNDSVMQL
ncbi:hypothetical protein Tco_0563734 [Tanacetum coccineum]